MRALSSLGIGLSLVSAFLLLALLAQLYYLLCWKKRAPNREIEEVGEEAHYKSPARELLYLFCWKKPNSLSSTALNPQEISAESNENHQHKDLLIPFGEEGMEAELMRLHSLSGPPRFLFTIKEETKEDLESEDGRSRGGRSRKSSGGRSLSDVLLAAETPPFLTPSSSPRFFTPPLTPNPLYESARSDEVNFSRMATAKASPPPKFKFLRDAEEKLYKKTLTEEAMRLHKMNVSDSVVANLPLRGKQEEDDSFITIIIGKNREKGSHHHHHPSSSQYLSNGPFKNADHHAVVNSNYSCLSIATFQSPAPDAIVCPLAIREGKKPILDEPMTFMEMYQKKMSRDLELAKLKKLAKENQEEGLEKGKDGVAQPKGLNEIFA